MWVRLKQMVIYLYTSGKWHVQMKNQVECSQIALCGLFSTVVKDAKKHQWRHIQGEVNSLHKLDRHYYGLFGFMLMNEKIGDKTPRFLRTCLKKLCHG